MNKKTVKAKKPSAKNTQISAPNAVNGYAGDPSLPSLSYIASLPDWALVRNILNGARAMRREKEIYLPRFGEESDDDYTARLAKAPFVNHFRDNLETIVSKPFQKEIALQGEVSDNIKAFAENIDGQGTSLHKFARDMFKEAVAQGVVGVLVDYTTLPAGATLATERNAGARPYWVSYRAEDIIAMYSEFRNGRRYVSHLRVREDIVKKIGYTERLYKRVRVLDDDGINRTWVLWELGGDGWTMVDQGAITLDEIPFRLFKPGEREWWTNATASPLIDLAYLQLVHYQASSNLDHVLDLAGFPMLAGNGVTPQMGADGKPLPIAAGPGVAIFAPPIPGTSTVPEWKFIEPAGTSIEKLQNQIDRIENQMSKIGKAPLVRQTGGTTATSEAVNSAKGQAAAEAWAIDLKDSLEQLLAFTSAWIKEKPTAEVYVHTDFGVELRENKENVELLDAYDSNVLSRDTLWDEWRRRGFLGPQFDPDKEKIAIAADMVEKMKHAAATAAIEQSANDAVGAESRGPKGAPPAANA